MATVKRAPATHPTVYVGLGLAAIGLMLAMYAYTGTRSYDIAYAFVALAGALLALGGIFTAAWGRAIMSARANRMRHQQGASHKPKHEPRHEEHHEAPPTVAEPPQKKAFDFASIAVRQLRRLRPAPRMPGAEAKASKPKAENAPFSFRRREAPPEPVPPDAPGGGVEPPLRTAPEPVVERVTLQCPRCATTFSAEGVRPLEIDCPSCGLNDRV